MEKNSKLIDQFINDTISEYFPKYNAPDWVNYHKFHEKKYLEIYDKLADAVDHENSCILLNTDYEPKFRVPNLYIDGKYVVLIPQHIITTYRIFSKFIDSMEIVENL